MKDSNTSLPSTYAAGMLQSKAYRALSNFMSAYLKPYNLSLPEWKALGYLQEASVLTPTDISNALGVKLPVTTRLLKNLEAKKLLKRKADSADNRVVRVKITPQGTKLALELEKGLRQEMKHFLADISQPELIAYMRVLSKLADKI